MRIKGILFLCLICCGAAKAQTPDTTGLALQFRQAERLFAEEAYAKAAAAYEPLIPLYQADPVRQTHCLTNLAVCYRQSGRPQDYEQTASKAFALVDAAPGAFPADVAIKAHHQYAFALYAKRDLDGMLRVAQKALQIASNRLPQPHILLGETYNIIAVVHKDRGQYAESVAYLRKAISAYEQGNADITYAYKAYTNIGSAYKNLSMIDSMFYYYQSLEQKIEALKEIPAQMRIEDFYNNYANAFLTTDNYEKALEYAQKAGGLIRKRHGDYNRLSVFNYHNTGLMYLENRQEKEALSSFAQALRVADSLWKTPNNIRASTLRHMGAAYARIHAMESAKQTWEKGLAESRALKDTATMGFMFHTMGQAYLDIGDRDQALRCYTEAIALISKVYSEYDSHLLDPYQGSAALLNSIGRYDEALDVTAKSLRIHCPDGDCSGPLADDASTGGARVRRDLDYTLLERAKALLGKWEKDRSDPALLEQAWQTNQRAISAAAYLRRHYQRSQAETYKWLAHNRELYTLGVTISRLRAQRYNNPALIEEAFRLADQSRVILLSESAHHAEARQFAGIPVELIKQTEQLSRQIAFYEGKSHEIAVGKNQSALAQQTDSMLFVLRRNHERLIAQIETDYPRYFELRYQDPVIKVSELRERLDPQAAFIEYVVNEARKELLIFYVDQAQGLQLIVAPWADETHQQIRELYTLSQSVMLQRADKRARFIELSHALYRQLIRPVAHLLAQKKQIVLVAEGNLNYLPFETLLESGENQSFAQLPYLLRRFDISYQYSAYMYVKTRKTQTPKPEASIGLLAFAPVFGRPAPSDAHTTRNSSSNERPLPAEAPAQFAPLHYSELEVQAIAQQFGRSKSKILLNESANEETLKAEIQLPHKIVHIASHSFANLAQPRFSGIACAYTSNGDSKEDGILYANEIYNLTMPADLVVLSSCESGLGQLADSEGLLGLNRAFAYAGVPNIAYSLWKVNDKAGSELMIEFYKQILAGKSYAAALRGAKLKMLENPATASPNLWGGFLLMGR